jgi:hypothetical protein
MTAFAVVVLPLDLSLAKIMVLRARDALAVARAALAEPG